MIRLIRSRPDRILHPCLEPKHEDELCQAPADEENLHEPILNEHPNIVPYNVMPTSDGHFILAVGNDSQFRKFCAFAGTPELADDPRFATNALRCENRRVLYDELLPPLTRQKTKDEWIDGLAALVRENGAATAKVHSRLDAIEASLSALSTELRNGQSGSTSPGRSRSRCSSGCSP